MADRGHSVAEVAARLGVSGHSLYQWMKRYPKRANQRQGDDELEAENRRLRAELKRVSEERDIYKKGHRVLRQRVRLRYAFIQSQVDQYPVRRLCKMMSVHPAVTMPGAAKSYLIGPGKISAC